MNSENNNLYHFYFEKLENNGICKQLIHVRGKGIKDNFKVSCENKGVIGIKSADLLMYDNPADSLSLISEKPSELVVVKDGKCTLKRYASVKRRTASTSSPISDADCNIVKNRIKNRNTNIDSYSDNHTRYLLQGYWRLFPPCFPFCIYSSILQALRPTVVRYVDKPVDNSKVDKPTNPTSEEAAPTDWEFK